MPIIRPPSGDSPSPSPSPNRPIVAPPTLGDQVPTLLIEIAFGSNPLTQISSQVWTDVTQYCMGFSTHVGRQHELNRVEAGAATFTFDNHDGRFDPFNTSSPYNPNVVPGKRIRISATFNSILYRVWNGFIENWGEGWANQNASWTTVTAADAFKFLNFYNLLNPYVRAVGTDGPFIHYLTSAGGLSFPVHGTGFPQRQGPLFSALVSLPLQAGSLTSVGPGNFSGTPTFNQIDPIADGVDGGVLFTGSTGDALTAPAGSGLSGTGDFSLECWFLHNSQTDTAHLMRQDPTALGVKLTLTAGALKLETFDASSTDYSVTSTLATYGDNQWHHAVATRSGTALKVYIDGALVGSATVGATVALAGTPLIVGPGTNAGEVTTMYEIAVYTFALSAAQVLAHFNAASAWKGDLSGARVGRILDQIGWAAADRNIETGYSMLQASPQPGNALGALTDVAKAENGLLFQDTNGNMTFFDRSHVVVNSASNTSQATFSDAANQLHYVLAGIQPKMDDIDLWNDLQVQASGGSLQESQDSASQTSYGVRTLALTNLTLASDNDALSRAQHDLSQYKQPYVRVRSFTVTPRSDAANLYPQVLGRKLWDQITFSRQPPGSGSRFTQTSLIEGIAHDYTPQVGWKTTYALVPTDPNIANYFILDSASQGVLGTNLLYY